MRTTWCPVAFEWTFEAALPTAFEDRTVHQDGFRTSADLVRYHQIGVGSGWVEIEGERTELDHDRCVSTRDHSWGVRYGVGVPSPDRPEVDALAGLGFQMVWCPLLFDRDDGTRYGMLIHFQIVTAPGLGIVHKIVMGGVEHPDGRFDPWLDLAPELHYDPANRRLRGGVIRATTGRRRDPRARRRGARRHGHPARRRSLLRLRRPPPRRMAG